MSSDIKIDVDGITAYVSEHPDADGLHHGTSKHTGDPVSVRWTGTEWTEATA